MLMAAKGTPYSQDVDSFEDTGFARSIFTKDKINLCSGRYIDSVKVTKMLNVEAIQSHSWSSLSMGNGRGKRQVNPMRLATHRRIDMERVAVNGLFSQCNAAPIRQDDFTILG